MSSLRSTSKTLNNQKLHFLQNSFQRYLIDAGKLSDKLTRELIAIFKRFFILQQIPSFHGYIFSSHFVSLFINSSTCPVNKNPVQEKTWSAPWITQVINSKKQIPDCRRINKISLGCLSALQSLAPHRFGSSALHRRSNSEQPLEW